MVLLIVGCVLWFALLPMIVVIPLFLCLVSSLYDIDEAVAVLVVVDWGVGVW